jgi:hypothetical protein
MRKDANHVLPVDSLSEIIFGLIMVLGFTSTARITLGEQSPQQFLWAVIGCNLAWGIVDGMMYILASVYERSQRARLADSIRGARDEATALALIDDEIDSWSAIAGPGTHAQTRWWPVWCSR